MPDAKTVEVEVLGPDQLRDFDLREATSAGDVAVRQRDAAPIVADRTGQGKGVVMNAAEAQARNAAVQLDGDAQARIADMLAGLEGGTDEIDDEQAATFLARRRANDGAHAPVHEEVVPEPREPNMLPAVMGQQVFYRDPNWQPDMPLVEPRWQLVYDTPRYVQAQIRGLARSIFRSFPCFARHQDETRNDDPLGMIRFVANFENQGPSPRAEVEAAARYIRENGMVVDNAELEFPNAMPGYRPRVVLAVTDDISMLLVEERRDNGCPVDGQSIYTWKGGRNFYLANPDAARLLGGIEGQQGPRQIAAPARALPAPGRAANRRPAAPQAGMDVVAGPRWANLGAAARRDPALRARPLVAEEPHVIAPPPPPAPVAPISAAERRAKMAALPVAPPAAQSSEIVNKLRGSGFLPGGSPRGPVLKKIIENGMTAEVSGETGKPIARSDVLTLRMLDETGDVVSEHVITGLDDLDAALEPSSAPKP